MDNHAYSSENEATALRLQVNLITSLDLHLKAKKQLNPITSARSNLQAITEYSYFTRVEKKKYSIIYCSYLHV